MSKELSIGKVSKVKNFPDSFEFGTLEKGHRYVDVSLAMDWEKEIGKKVKCTGKYINYEKIIKDKYGVEYQSVSSSNEYRTLKFLLDDGRIVKLNIEDVQNCYDTYEKEVYVYNWICYSDEPDYSWGMTDYKEFFNKLIDRHDLKELIKIMIAHEYNDNEPLKEAIITLTAIYFSLKKDEYAIMIWD